MDILKKNFFELFNIDISVNVNLLDLDRKLKELQLKFHPDKFSNTSDYEKRLATMVSSYINDGYKVLSNILLRVDYILKINSYNIDESKTINNINFLQEQIEYSELIDAMRSNPNENKINIILNDIKKHTNNTIQEICESFEISDFDKMWNLSSKLKFYIKNTNELLSLKKI